MSNRRPFPSDLAGPGGNYPHSLHQSRSYLDSESDISDSTDDEEESNLRAPRFQIAFGQRQSRTGGYNNATTTHERDNTISAGSLKESDEGNFSHQANSFYSASSPTNSNRLIRSMVSPARMNARNNNTTSRGIDGFGLGTNALHSDYNATPSGSNSHDHGMVAVGNGFDTASTSSVSRPQGLPLDPVAVNNRVRSPPHRPRVNSRRRVSLGSENRIQRSGSHGGSAPYFIRPMLSSYNNPYESDTNAVEAFQYNGAYSHDPSVDFSTKNLQDSGDIDASSPAPILSFDNSNPANTQPKPSTNSVVPSGNRRPSPDAHSSFTFARLAAVPSSLPDHDSGVARAPMSHSYSPWLDVHSDSDDDLDTENYRLFGRFSGSASDDIVIDGLTARRLSENSDYSRNVRLRQNPATDNAMKCLRDKSGFTLAKSTDLMNSLAKKGAVSILLYHSGSSKPEATDVWPDIRDGSKIPARYFRLSQEDQILVAPPDRANHYDSRDSLRPSKSLKLESLSQRGKRNQGWPTGIVPTEMFEEIAGYLSRDDIKSMRLVCREFDRHVSQVLFNTVVVPFNTEIYGMLGTEKKQDIKGKGKIMADTNKGLSWKNANGDDVYNGHGLDVFRGFGPHILKYGMSFDVDEDALARPPYKGTTEGHISFWGTYDWPFEEYRRFDDVAGLELAADETPKMKIAFSMLQKVQELALSVDSGLGWLRGPDRSIRARVLRQSPQVFGRSKDIPDRKTQAQKELWDYIEATHRAADMDVKLATLYRMDMSRPFSELQSTLDSRIPADGQCDFPFMDPHLIAEATPDDIPDAQIPSFEDVESLEAFVEPQTLPTTGIIYSATLSPSDAAQLRSPIVPAQLTKAQKEWLLETEWAQRAFLSSYMLAVIDNPTTFKNVHTLNIARVSSRYTFSLCRQDFWDALPQLKSVVIQAIPDWRNVLKDEAGFVETPRIDPSYAIGPFHQLLKEIISPRVNIKNLTFGWAAGGEHAEGVHARNKHILPAPILPDDATLILYPGQVLLQMLHLPHVENLTLKNCWLTPPALQALVKRHDTAKLQKLTLESVSLTAMPRMVANQNQNQNNNLNLNVNLPQGAVAAQQGIQLVNPPNHMGIAPAIQQGHANLQPQQLLALQIQALQIQVQQLQTQQNAHAQAQANALQVQLQAQLQLQAHLQAHGVAMGIPPPPPPPPPQQFTVMSAVRAKHREGSWPYVIDIISPRHNLSNFGSEYSNAEPGRVTNLRRLEFVSCGYVRLPHSTIDQAALEPANPMIRLPHFTKRYNALVPAMLSSKDPLLGEIIQEVEPMELSALFTAWSLNQGWGNLFERQGSEFDGLLPGGTGRFSGII